MSLYYRSIGDAKQSVEFSRVVLELTTHLDNVNLRSNLNSLEKNLSKEYNQANSHKIKKVKNYLSAAVLFLIVVMVVFVRNYSKGKKKKKNSLLINEQLKDKLQHLNQIQKEQEILLNQRQSDILRLIKQGKTNKEIANELFISENTVKYHIKNIFEASGVTKRSDLT